MKSWVEISAERLARNFRAVKVVAGDSVETLAVIKADGYGHGAAECAAVLTAAGARWLGVTDVDEGQRVRVALGESETRLLVMQGLDVSEDADAAALVQSDLTPVVWTAAHVGMVEQAGRAAGQKVRVHVEVDTGMSRQGVAVGATLGALLERIAASEWIVIEGVMTHLCCSEVAGATTTERAQELFEDVLRQVRESGLRPEFVHLSNTSAVDEGSTTEWVRGQASAMGARAMVRTGLAMYGHCLAVEGPGAEPRLAPKLEPVMTWNARVLDVREVPEGATVGYGATFVAPRPMRLALLGVGYADGFRREASSGVGNGWVMVNGERAAVVGRVSMNLITVDISSIGGVVEGTEAVLLGEGVSAEDHARWAGTIPYEILCGVRAPRVVR